MASHLKSKLFIWAYSMHTIFAVYRHFNRSILQYVSVNGSTKKKNPQKPLITSMKSTQLNHHTQQITAKQERTTPKERMNEKVYAESNATAVNC